MLAQEQEVFSQFTRSCSSDEPTAEPTDEGRSDEEEFEFDFLGCEHRTKYDYEVQRVAAIVDPFDDLHVVFSAGPHRDWGHFLYYATLSEAGWDASRLWDIFGSLQSTSLSLGLVAVRDERLAWIDEYNWGRQKLEMLSISGDVSSTQTVDTDVTPGSNVSLAVDDEGRIHLVYEDGGVMYAVMESGEWTSELVDLEGYAPELALGPDGVLIAYVARPREGGYEVRLGRPGAAGLETSVLSVQDAGVGSPSAPPDVGVDSLGFTHLTFSDARGLLYSRADLAYWSEPEVIMDGPGTVSMAVESWGIVHIAYATSSEVRYAVRRDREWSVEPVGGASNSAALVLDREGRPLIAMEALGRLVLATWGSVTDGVDTDCDGLDELPACFDADGDGQRAIGCGGTDCDDTEADVRVGASDDLGDGTDQDCDGIDGVDRDEDGAASSLAGGDDCDDTDADTHVGASDPEGDCVDQNCDGEGGPTPDAVGDGIDSDCDGVDGMDADGDGWASTASGGSDCDDASQEVRPDAADGSREWRWLRVAAGSPSSPSLAIDSTGVLHATWLKGEADEVRYGMRAGEAWTRRTIDEVGAGDSDPAIAIGPDDVAHIVYRENDADELRWATNGAGPWVHESIDATGVPGIDNAIAVGADGMLHVVYTDAWDRETLKYSAQVGGLWSEVVVDADGATGHDAAVAIDAAGAIHVAYAEIGDEDLRHAALQSGVWTVETIDAGESRAHYVSLAVGSDGALHVAYRVGERDEDPAAELWYATNASGVWRPERVDRRRDSGRGTGIAVDEAGVRIAYTADGELLLAANGSGAWESESIRDRSYEDMAFAIDPRGNAHLLTVAPPGGELFEWTDEVLPDGVDQNCDGVDGTDGDADLHASFASGGDDCDDEDENVHPGAADDPGGSDEDCDGGPD